jgi:hypothetical protein
MQLQKPAAIIKLIDDTWEKSMLLEGPVKQERPIS